MVRPLQTQGLRETTRWDRRLARMALNILSRQSTRAAILSGVNALASDYSSVLARLHCCGKEEVMFGQASHLPSHSPTVQVQCRDTYLENTHLLTPESEILAT